MTEAKLTVTCAKCGSPIPTVSETWTEGPPVAVSFVVDPCKPCAAKAGAVAERAARDRVYREMSSC